jgi:ABC-type enterobactin transport system permease subunit
MQRPIYDEADAYRELRLAVALVALFLGTLLGLAGWIIYEIVRHI